MYVACDEPGAARADLLDFISEFHSVDRSVVRPHLYHRLDMEAARHLFRVAGERPLPAYARDIDCANWAQFFLKFVVSHPLVTCAIPATSKAAHITENIGALYGRLPDPELRKRMAKDIQYL